MKRFSLWLVALSLALTAPALAQRTPIAATNVEALQKISNAATKDYQANRSLALKLAKEKNWVIEKSYSDGTFISLQGVDSNGLPIYYITYNNTRAAATTKTDQLWAGGALGLTLSGAGSVVSDKLGMWDGGRVRDTHQELKTRIVQRDNATQAFNSHATHVAGTMMASGVSSYAKGMAHGLKTLQAYDFDNDRAEMATAASEGMLISNHSYGAISGWRYDPDRPGTQTNPNWEWWGDADISDTLDYKFGYYDQTAAAWDNIAFNAPNYLMVKSAGNNRSQHGPEVGQPYHRRNKNGTFTLVTARPANISKNGGYDIIPTTGNAKNILTVGAVSAITNGYNQPSDVSISSFSSYGPTDDGRIKPDIVGNGVAVLSSSSESDQTYGSSSGTSMSAPNVSGTLLLLQEHYSNLNRGAVMRSATLKGLAIHTADEAGTAPGPDYIYGWGLLNAAKAANLVTGSASSAANKGSMIQERTLNQSQTYQLNVVASGSGPLAFTISWTDPAGNVIPLGSSALNNRSPRLVNDLDIRLSDGSNNFLPWTLNPLNPSEKAKPGDNVVDNVEQILITNPIPGRSYTLTVSHKGTLNNSKQDYSLLVSGAGGTAYCSSAASENTGSNVKLVTIGSYNRAFPADACTTYRNLAGSDISFEPGQTQTITIEAGSCGASAAKKVKAYIDWNRDGDFADENEDVLLAGTGPYSAALTAPGTVVAGENILMRVVLQETNDAAAVLPCGSYSRGETQDHYIRIIKQQRDVGVVSVSPLGSSFCANSNQKIVVKLQNFGAAAQTNFPVSVTVKKGGVQVTRLSKTYTGTLAAFSEEEVVLDGSFATEAGASYEFVAEAGLENDAVVQNNRLNRTIMIASPVGAPQASAFRCGSNSDFSLTSNDGSNTFWYTSLTATVPVAAGNVIVPGSKIGNSSLYAAFGDFSATIGPANKNFATGGGYNKFTPDVLINTKAPVVLESARLYIGHSGKITFTVFTPNGAPVSSKTLHVKATRTVEAKDVQPNDPNDQGEVYYLGLEIPAAGDYNIAISYEDGATIFRNNEGVNGYPFGITDVFTITGNTASPGSTGYYYYFYDLKVKALGCKSERVAVNVVSGTPIPQPVVKINGHSLVSNEATGNNWYLNGVEIPEAKGSSTFTPSVTGSYSVKVIRDGCISEMSVPVSFIFDPEVETGPELDVYPNPGNGVFTIRLATPAQEDITFEVYDLMGRLLLADTIKQKYGHVKGTIDFKPRASGVYILRVKHGSTLYVKRLVVQK